jgi:hypothetical protein
MREVTSLSTVKMLFGVGGVGAKAIQVVYVQPKVSLGHTTVLGDVRIVRVLPDVIQST